MTIEEDELWQFFKIPITSHSCHTSHAHGDTLNRVSTEHDRRLRGGRRSSPETDTGKARKVLWLYANITCCHLTLYMSWITQISIVKSLLHPSRQPSLQSFWVCVRIHSPNTSSSCDETSRWLLQAAFKRPKRKTRKKNSVQLFFFDILNNWMFYAFKAAFLTALQLGTKEFLLLHMFCVCLLL